MGRWRPPARVHVLCTGLCLALFGARLAAQPRFSETALGMRPTGALPLAVATSNAMRLAYVVRTTDGEALVLDGVVGRTYSVIPSPTLLQLAEGVRHLPAFSPDGQHVAYRAKRGDYWHVVVDTIEGPPFDEIESQPVFSEDSRQVAYVAKRAGQRIVVRGDNTSLPYDQVHQQLSYPAGFTADGKLFHKGRRGTREYLVIDGKEVVEADQIGFVAYHPERGRFAVSVREADGWKVVVDGVKGKTYPLLGNVLHFSKDGRRVLYEARDSLTYVVVDGVESQGFEHIDPSYGFSDDGAHVAYFAHKNGKLFWVLDGRPQKAYDWVGAIYRPMFSPNGQRLTYAARERDSMVVVTGDRESERFDGILHGPYFLADGRRVFVAKRGGQHFVNVDTATTIVDEVGWPILTSRRFVVPARHGEYWSIVGDAVPSARYREPVAMMAVSADERRVAYSAGRDGKRFVVVDGIEGQPYDSVQTANFSPDGRHLAYAAKRLGKWMIVVDGVESPHYDEILAAPQLDRIRADGLSVVARRGRMDFRVRVDWSR